MITEEQEQMAFVDWLKIKRKKYSTTSKEQKEWLEILEMAGIPSKVCRGASEAIEFVENML